MMIFNRHFFPLVFLAGVLAACGGGQSTNPPAAETNPPGPDSPVNLPEPSVVAGNLLKVDPRNGDDRYSYAQVSAGTRQWASPERALWGSTNRNTPNASEAAQPGDVIELADGVYVGQGIQNGMTGQSPRNLAAFTPYNSGTEGRPIILRAANPRQARLQASPDNANNAVVSTLWAGTGTGRSYFYVQDLVIDWSANEDTVETYGPGEFAAVKFLGGSNNRLENCDIIGRFNTRVNRGTNWAAVFLQNNRNIIIRNNHIRDHGYNGDGAAIEWYSAPDSLVEFNTITNVDGVFLIKTDQRGVDHKNIIVRYNYAKDVMKKSVMITRHIGRPEEPTLIYQNVFVNVGKSAGMGLWDLAQYGTTAHVYIVNNSFYAPLTTANASGQYNYQNMNNVVLSNNIIATGGNAMINAGGTAGSGIPAEYWRSNYNCYQKIGGTFKLRFHGADYNSLSDWQALGEDGGSVYANPRYRDPENGDLRLQADSPCLNLAADTLALFAGRDTINAGAYVLAGQSDRIGASW